MGITKASKSPLRDLTIIPTGFSKLDAITGVGGIPTRKITEIAGKESVGKSTLSMLIAAQAQKMKMDVLWADTEFSWTGDYEASLGINCDKIDLLQEEFGDTVLNEIEGWARKHKNALIVLDSVGGLLPREEAEKEAGAKVIAGQSKLLAPFIRKMVPILAVNNNALVVLNHTALDIMTGNLVAKGGGSLLYHKSLAIWLSKTKNILKQGEKMIGRQIEAKIKKTKVGKTQEQTCTLNLVFGEGFSVQADILEEALDKGIITRKGPSYFVLGQKFFGQTKLRAALQDDVFAAKIKEALKQADINNPNL